MEKAAIEYCLVIENLATYRGEQWLAEIGGVLPQIQKSMTQYDDPNIEYGFFSLPDLEDRFKMYCMLKDRLGSYDEYWLHYDQQSVVGEMSGSLASDFSDIYFELKRGLNLLQIEGTSSADVFSLWQTGFILYWGEQLMSAQRHLSTILATIKRQLQ